jgi:hypothetical protein
MAGVILARSAHVTGLREGERAMLIRDITIIEQGAAMIHVRIGLAIAYAGPRPGARLAGNPPERIKALVDRLKGKA